MFADGARYGENDIEAGPFRGVQVKKYIIGMKFVVETAGPRVVIDATQIREIKQIRAVVRHKVRHRAVAFFGMNQGGSQPCRPRLRRFLLKEELTLDAVWVAFQNQRTVFQKWQNKGSNSEV